jgi:hypothetical protein
MATEVYSCRDGQEIKQGKLDYCEIDNRGAAEADAKRRCAQDPSLKRIVYYRVAPDGAFKLLSSYTNPHCTAVVKQDPSDKFRPRTPGATAKRPGKPGLLDRIKGAIGLS